jgi:MFS family permease
MMHGMAAGVFARSVQGYRELLSSSATRRVMAWGLFARLPMGMLALGLVFLVRGAGGSYAAAGAVSAANALTAALGAPVGGRLLDRYAPSKVLAAYGVLHGAALMVLVGFAWADLSIWALGIAATVAGFVFPPIGSAVRVLWPVLAPHEPLRTKAYALEATLQELVFVTGPLVVGVLAALLTSSTGIIGAAVISVVGVGGFAALGIIRSLPYGEHHHEDSHLLRALRPPIVRRIIVFSLGYGLTFGAVEVALPAFAESHGGRELGGLALAAWSSGSLVGGFVAGMLPPGDPHRRLRVASTAFLGVLVLPLFAHSMPMMMAAMFVVGLPIAPSFAITYGMVQDAALRGTQAEVFGWLTTSTVVGVAVGAAAGGWLITHISVDASFLLAIAGTIAAVVVARVPRPVARDMLPE